jgi:hypothetical protein
MLWHASSRQCAALKSINASAENVVRGVMADVALKVGRTRGDC